jgi:hypothetical protein
MGPDDPLFHLLEDLCFQDVFGFFEDFTTVFAGSSGGWDGVFLTSAALAGGTNYARTANILGGQVRANGTTTAGDGATIFSTSNEVVVTNARPYALIRHRPGSASAITTSKLEFGFMDAVGPMVNVKATPSSTGTDYAVIIRDTTDGTETSLIVDSTTNAIASVDANAAAPVWATDTYQVWMLALNEQNAAYFWIDGIFAGVQRGNGPDDNTSLGIGTHFITRTSGNSRDHDIDYIKLACNRTVF